MSTTKLDTLLDAVNLCLMSVGRQPVPSLDTPDLDVAQALMSVENVTLDVLDNSGHGWWFNHEDNWILTPDQYNGTVLVPNNVMSLVEAGTMDGTSISHTLTIRGGKLYDKKMHTFDLRRFGVINCAFTMVLPFEDMPVSARRAIAWRARAIFAWDVEGDGSKLQANQAIAEVSIKALSNQHVTQMRFNANNSRTMQEFRGGVEGYSFIDAARGRY